MPIGKQIQKALFGLADDGELALRLAIELAEPDYEIADPYPVSFYVLSNVLFASHIEAEAYLQAHFKEGHDYCQLGEHICLSTNAARQFVAIASVDKDKPTLLASLFGDKLRKRFANLPIVLIAGAAGTAIPFLQSQFTFNRITNELPQLQAPRTLPTREGIKQMPMPFRKYFTDRMKDILRS